MVAENAESEVVGERCADSVQDLYMTAQIEILDR
jgi:hypothetical protein